MIVDRTTGGGGATQDARTLIDNLTTTFMDFSVLGFAKIPMLSVFRIKDGKIARMWAFRLGVNAPFDNAAR